MGQFSDEDLDDMHHALGRPDGPHVKPYRNRYVIGRDTEQARRMAASPAWKEVARMNEGADSVFAVTDAGKAALWRWLRAKHKAAGVRAYRVTGEGLSERVVMAKSRAAAKADVWRDLSDLGLEWPEFLACKPRAVLAGV